MGRDVGYLYRVGERVCYTPWDRRRCEKFGEVVKVGGYKVTVRFDDTQELAVWPQRLCLVPLSDQP